MTKTKGIDVAELDTKVRPQDDFFQYANGGWISKNPVPKAESRWGTFLELRRSTDKRLHQLLLTVSKQKRVITGSKEQMLRDFYLSGTDMQTRNASGLSPLSDLRKKITSVTDMASLTKIIVELHIKGPGVFFGAGVDQDSKKSTAYALHMYQSGLGMPDRDYYLKDDAESVRVREAYKTYITKLYTMMGEKPVEAKKKMREQLAFETKLASISMTKEDRHDAEKVYHKKTRKELRALMKGFPIDDYLTRIGAGKVKYVIAMQPKFLSGLGTLLRDTPLETLKNYMECQLVNVYAGYLSASFIKARFAFYGTVLSGTKTMQPLWRRVMGSVNKSLGDLLGQMYVERYFSRQAKHQMEEMVGDLFRAYATRIKAVSWMSKTTKKKALKKLSAMNTKIGYPRKWRSYKGLLIKNDDYVGNEMRSGVYEYRRNMRKLNKPLDREEWHMNAHTVNAYFAPNLNDIVFPAGILQEPFFSVDADPVLNYGAIGSVIGHEITHGFDDDGSKFDEKGNMKNWWTPTDRKRFMKKAKLIEKQFDQYTVADGVKVNGRLTLGENIADLGGVSIALDAYRLRYGTDEEKDENGLTTTERFFLAFSLFEREHVRPEMAKLMALNDPHSPAKFRINGTLANVEDFYKTYNVTTKDKLYRAPNIRAKIW
jgi:putative endopeptidase